MFTVDDECGTPDAVEVGAHVGLVQRRQEPASGAWPGTLAPRTSQEGAVVLAHRPDQFTLHIGRVEAAPDGGLPLLEDVRRHALGVIGRCDELGAPGDQLKRRNAFGERDSGCDHAEHGGPDSEEVDGAAAGRVDDRRDVVDPVGHRRVAIVGERVAQSSGPVVEQHDPSELRQTGDEPDGALGCDDRLDRREHARGPDQRFGSITDGVPGNGVAIHLDVARLRQPQGHLDVLRIGPSIRHLDPRGPGSPMPRSSPHLP